ncbi:unnamed protein product [Commensalibacter communis]|uniref:Uncharacterized protein n=1 Tax=Commensalibacter communis TaxID=2972786 RepID=A0A9W4TMT5_9PROT|nr:hypothetical protein [Commensalibacter communis]CAI3924508.1 unnamed protein product [Commensalibacter communis]CAI3925994.1 unnamed protein product [Commensalibacter communis]CAI3928695.1 unnamed protein product [Commensalibacter communis]CAI3936449.1 unnamed protein product [Commensalibacter communis]CAI3936974.1 unnamed protein product [Commensalibacter communis]
MMFWLLTFSVTLLHLMMVLLLAPWVMGFQKWLEAKIQGLPVVPFWFYWGEIYSVNIKRLSSFLTITYSYTSLLPFIALGAAIIAALLVPSFTVGMVTASFSDLLLIIALLMMIPVSFFLVSLRYDSLKSLKLLQTMLVDNLLFLPVLFFVLTIIRFITGSTFLDTVVIFFHQFGEFPLMAYCPLLVVAFSLLFVVWDMPNFSQREGMDGFGGADRGLLLYTNDVQFLVWLSLIALFLWPQSLVILQLGDHYFINWLRAVPFGILAWVTKIIAECFILAMMRSLLLFSSGIYRVGIAVVLSFLAIILYFAGLSGE